VLQCVAVGEGRVVVIMVCCRVSQCVAVEKGSQCVVGRCSRRRVGCSDSDVLLCCSECRCC